MKSIIKDLEFPDLNKRVDLISVRVKVCCIQSNEEAAIAVRFGASALGFVSAMPSGFGPIPEDKISEIVKTIPSGIETFLLTSLTDVDSIVAQNHRCRTAAIQLVDRLERGTHADLRSELPGISLVQVIHVGSEQSIAEAKSLERQVDALLLDSGNQTLPIKELGGTGRVHDWSISRKIRESVGIPVYLAGGLTPLNVRRAIEIVRPYGVDVCTGIRNDGVLDEGMLVEFMQAIRRAPAG